MTEQQTRVEQRQHNDCQTAVAAMLADDWTYDELADAYGVPMSNYQISNALRSEGYHYGQIRVSNVLELADIAHYFARIDVTVESPISERDPAGYHELTEEFGSFDICHAIAIRDGEVFDPKPDPYFRCWDDLRESPYSIRRATVYTETDPRTIDFRSFEHQK